MKKLIFLISCFFLMMNSTWAITLSCPEVASPGEIVQCRVNDNQYIGIKTKYEYDPSFSYQRTVLNSKWNHYYSGIDGFSVGTVKDYTELSLDVEFKINMDIEVNQNYEFCLSDIEGVDSSYQYQVVDSVKDSILVVSDINTLDSLSVDNVNIKPNFDKNVMNYETTVKSDKVVIKATLTDKDAKVEGDIGEKSLQYGLNTFVIKVTSVRGNVREYNLYITRVLEEVKKSNDVTLKSLNLSEGNIDFKKDKFLYEITVDNNVDKINVEAVSNSDKAKIDIQNIEHLQVGSNTIKVIVTAEDGTVGTYVIIVNKKEKLSSDASIKNLFVKGYDLNFSPDNYSYELEIDNEEKLEIDVILNDDRAKYKISGNKNLRGNSVINIEVTAEDGSVLNYKIKIIKSVDSNSSVVSDYIKFVPLIIFVVLIMGILVVKILKSRFVKN